MLYKFVIILLFTVNFTFSQDKALSNFEIVEQFMKSLVTDSSKTFDKTVKHINQAKYSKTAKGVPLKKQLANLKDSTKNGYKIIEQFDPEFIDQIEQHNSTLLGSKAIESIVYIASTKDAVIKFALRIQNSEITSIILFDK